MYEEIEKTIKSYLQAIHEQDYDRCYDLLDKDEAAEYKKGIQDFAEKIEPFGEAGDFLKLLSINSLSEMKAMSDKEFLINIFKSVSREIDDEDLKIFVDSAKIVNIDATEYLTIVKYQYSFPGHGEWIEDESEIHMIYKENRWQIIMRPGMGQIFERFEKDIELYYQRKALDQAEKADSADDLERYHLIGFKNYAGEVVLEARFKDAGDFSEGLAYAKVFEKYGYINQKGEFAIKPRFDEASDFQEGLAAVGLNNGSFEVDWGFIDKQGHVRIPCQYQSTHDFSEGLCAVQNQESDWGFIDKNGKVIIPFSFLVVTDFEDGEAEVTLKKEDGEVIIFSIDKEGNWLD